MSCDVGKATKGWRMSCDVGEVTKRLENEQSFFRFSYIIAYSPNLPLLHLSHSSFSNPSVSSPTSQFTLQSFFRFSLRHKESSISNLHRHFTYVLSHSPTLPSLHLRHNSFSNPAVALPTSQLILQPFCCLTYVTVHSPTLPLLHLRHSSFSNLSVTSPTSQLILQPFRCFTYVTVHSPILSSLYLTLQLIPQHFRCFTYVTVHSPTLLSLLLCHKLFTQFTWRAAHGPSVKGAQATKYVLRKL